MFYTFVAALQSFEVHPQEEKANLELQAAGLTGRMKNPQNSKSSAMKWSEFKIRPTREEGARKSALATQLTRGMPAMDVQLLSLEMCIFASHSGVESAPPEVPVSV